MTDVGRTNFGVGQVLDAASPLALLEKAANGSGLLDNVSGASGLLLFIVPLWGKCQRELLRFKCPCQRSCLDIEALSPAPGG